MTRPVVRDVLDFAAHPQVAVPGEGRAECALDLLVEAADGEDPAPGAGLVPGVGVGRGLGLGAAGAGPVPRGGGQWRSLGIEELMGTAGHR